MTKEQMERGNKIQELLKSKIQDLEGLPHYKKNEQLYVKSSVGHNFQISKEIRDTVLVIVEAQLKKEIEALEKEFNEL